MKYLNRYNEELNKNKISKEVETWKKQVETYSKYGTIKVIIETESLNTNNEEEFYFCFYPWLDRYKDDTYDLVRGCQGDDWEIDTQIYLEMWLIPKTEEQLYRIKEELEPDQFDGIGFQTNTLRIDFKLEPNNFDIYNHNFYYNDGQFPSYVNVKIADIASAIRIKEILNKFFSDSSIEYTIPDFLKKGYKTMYRTLLSVILADTGISSKCGIGMDDFAEYIYRISENIFMGE